MYTYVRLKANLFEVSFLVYESMGIYFCCAIIKNRSFMKVFFNNLKMNLIA